MHALLVFLLVISSCVANLDDDAEVMAKWLLFKATQDDLYGMIFSMDSAETDTSYCPLVTKACHIFVNDPMSAMRHNAKAVCNQVEKNCRLF